MNIYQKKLDKEIRSMVKNGYIDCCGEIFPTYKEAKDIMKWHLGFSHNSICDECINSCKHNKVAYCNNRAIESLENNDRSDSCDKVIKRGC